MTPVVLKMETIQQKAQYQISNMVLARKNRGKGTGTASNAYKAHIILLTCLLFGFVLHTPCPEIRRSYKHMTNHQMCFRQSKTVCAHAWIHFGTGSMKYLPLKWVKSLIG